MQKLFQRWNIYQDDRLLYIGIYMEIRVASRICRIVVNVTVEHFLLHFFSRGDNCVLSAV